jgi:hypothetical protein
VRPKWPSVIVAKNKDNELFSTHFQTGWQGFIDYNELKAIKRKDHFPPPFIDHLKEWLGGHPYYHVLDDYSSYSHVPLDLDKQENTTSHLLLVSLPTCRLDHATHLLWKV